MKTILLEKGELTPAVFLEEGGKTMCIDGRCIPEDAHSFFTPIINWIGDFFTKKTPDKNEEFTLEIKCDYYNSASAKMFVYLFDKVAGIQKSGYNLRIAWYCQEDDPDLIESVNDYKAITSAEIKIILQP